MIEQLVSLLIRFVLSFSFGFIIAVLVAKHVGLIKRYSDVYQIYRSKKSREAFIERKVQEAKIADAIWGPFNNESEANISKEKQMLKMKVVEIGL